jgi:RimJ/RimL family protein N-acetyltransferase
MIVLRTTRLELRHLEPEDAAFVLDLFNQPSFVRNIGDRGIRDPDDARRYVREGPGASYARHGFGLWGVQPRAGGELLGICGLVRRDYLEDVDVGFAFLPQHWSRGYALESATAVLGHARDVLGIRRIAAIVSPGNSRSISVLERLGLRHERNLVPPGAAGEVMLFARGLD